MPVPDHPQPDLFGATAEVHRLFFALLPDRATRTRLEQAARSIGSAHPEVSARRVPSHRYHATLHFLGDHSSLRQDVVAAAVAAADRLSAEPFEWMLDEAASFRASQPPWVVRGSDLPEPLQHLWQGLRGALILAGQGRHLARQFTPHVTIAYGDHVALEPVAIDPVRWRVERFALLASASSRPDYQTLAEWSLQGGTVQRHPA